MSDKYDEIIDNIINGNWGDVKRMVNRMSKIDMLNLIEYSEGQGLMRRQQIINNLRIALD